ncbi:1749_t:CDS:1, partial [Acaulospora morrowiae]
TENRWSQIVEEELGEASTSTQTTPKEKAYNKERQNETIQILKNNASEQYNFGIARINNSDKEIFTFDQDTQEEQSTWQT